MEVRLIVAADEPALFFSSPQAAEGYLEPIDVEDGVYPVAYGPAGEVFVVGLQDGRVVIIPDSSQPTRPDELRRLIMQFLSVAGVRAPTGDLADLVRICTPFLSA